MPDAGNQVTADHKSITIHLSSDSCQSDVKSESESDINIIKVVVPIRSSELRYRYDTYTVQVVDIKLKSTSRVKIRAF